ncbi:MULTISPECIES: enoyl-CoA hydratase/isomerase family protein [Thermomonosporaceae]|uniref:enoyl-CoA hydratase/isomerase family protein n=1 Tax=Thermomonosporaceae TaxID=2012 RepID=UPI00255AD6A9|nr:MULTISPECIES: enoyl-CoA hydratase-related protein [Thermomonosporaceae]MDL4776519.1 enoyl-CoA hydratase-related protein [Actinomadura xylanilytica]
MSGAETRIHEHLAETRGNGVAVLRVDREAALGALSRGMVEALGGYLTRLRSDEDVRVLVLTGTGRGFIAGADLNEYSGVGRTAFDDYQKLSRSVFDQLAALPQPTVAAVNGYALGGGFEVALCCDLIVASTAARFGLPEISLGLLPGGGGTVRLTRAVGARVAKELVLTGRRIKAPEARDLRLVTAVVEADELLPRALELAGTIARQAPLAAREAKRLVDDGLETGQAAALTREQQVLSWLYTTADAQEGVAAFLEKREAVFHGR